MKWLKRRKRRSDEDSQFGPTFRALDKQRKKGSDDSLVDAMAIPGSPLWILKKVFGDDKEKDK